MHPPVNGHSKVNGVVSNVKARNGKLTNGRARTSDFAEEEPIVPKKQKRSRRRQEEEEEEEDQEESMQILDAGGDEEVDHVDEEEQEEQDDSPVEPEPEEEVQEESIQESPPVQPPKSAKRRGRKPKLPVTQEEEEPSELEPAPAQVEEVEVEDEPVKKRRGRPARPAQQKEETEPTKKKSPKRGRPRRSSEGSVEEESQEQEDNGEERETKRQRVEESETRATSSSKATAAATTKEKGKLGRKRKSSGVGVEEPVVQRGPPLPKSRGLVINRQEEDIDKMRTTRSGRLSYRPIEFWKGEHAVFDTGRQHVFEDKGGRFVMPSVKGILRTNDAAFVAPKRRRGRPPIDKSSGPRGSGGRRGRRSDAILEEVEEVERDDWEFEPGRIAGECLFWRPEHEGQAPDEDDQEIAEEELAVSEAAIQLKDIKDATFRFAKTLTLPFFGSGIVDMPPGSEKRTKNSRKMQMVFFVHAGSVEVTVASTEFRIAKGGMWFVPRGKFFLSFFD